jgi:prepilin-type N-terminal cleavage/methylation domain-containing protein
MLGKLQTKKQEGFTIIEVLIVLAIAGLILLIVFLAVPALQRNSRNTSRRNDVAKLLGLISEHASSTNGGLPTNAVCATTEMTLNAGAGTPTVTAPGNYYCRTTGATISWNNLAADGTNPSTVDSVVMRSGAICDANGNIETTGATARNTVAVFRLEVNVPQCQSQ